VCNFELCYPDIKEYNILSVFERHFFLMSNNFYESCKYHPMNSGKYNNYKDMCKIV
jgi:hypothetical protein